MFKRLIFWDQNRNRASDGGFGCEDSHLSNLEKANYPNKNDVRICVDIRRTNKAIQREILPIPTVDELLEEINGSKIFSKLHINTGFHQIQLEEWSRDVTTFSAGDSLYRYKRPSFRIEQ